jgi:hypothetical protein
MNIKYYELKYKIKKMLYISSFLLKIFKNLKIWMIQCILRLHSLCLNKKKLHDHKLDIFLKNR